MLLIVGVLIAGRRRKLTPIDCARRTAYNAIVSLHGQDWAVDTLEKLPNGVQPQISVEDLALCEEIIKRDERVIKLAAEVGPYILTCNTTSRFGVLTRRPRQVSSQTSFSLMVGRSDTTPASPRANASSKLSCSRDLTAMRICTRTPW